MGILRDLGVCTLFGIIGIIIMVAGYKIFDWAIPLDFNKELEKNNISVAIVIAGLLIGIAYIIGRVIGI